MPSKSLKYTFRADAVMLEKLRYIAAENFRSANKELEMLVQQRIASYEEKHGTIPISSSLSSSVQGGNSL